MKESFSTRLLAALTYHELSRKPNSGKLLEYYEYYETNMKNENPPKGA